MNIPINRNIDEFKDDFYKGLSFRQCCFAGLTIVFGGFAFLISFVLLGLPQMISIYVCIVFAVPPAVWGFVQIKGMPSNVYIRKKMAIKKTPLFLYRSDEGFFDREIPKTKKKKKKAKKEKVMLLCQDRNYL